MVNRVPDDLYDAIDRLLREENLSPLKISKRLGCSRKLVVRVKEGIIRRLPIDERKVKDGRRSRKAKPEQPSRKRWCDRCRAWVIGECYVCWLRNELRKRPLDRSQDDYDEPIRLGFELPPDCEERRLEIIRGVWAPPDRSGEGERAKAG